jgi:hypothetical protein
LKKKDEINEYKKKRNTKKKEKTKRRAYQCPRPLSLNIYVKKQCRHINRAGNINVID